jgi:hydroxymethylpyrimidine/phosphomethylpyrimidine kinase
MGCGAVLMKGGHLDDAESPDWLFTRDGEVRFAARTDKNTHGTGCTLSAALAALRPRHDNWADTVREANLALGGAGKSRYSGSRSRYWAGSSFSCMVVSQYTGRKHHV